MTSKTGPILAVVDCAAGDEGVLTEAVWLARAAHADVVLVHVARPLGGASPDSARQQIGLQQRLLREMQGLAEHARTCGVAADIDDVYFGDTAAEVAYAASRRRASAVVAARRPSRLPKLLGWRSRDVRLARRLSVPLVLTDARAADNRGIETAPALELLADELLPAPSGSAAAALQPPPPAEQSRGRRAA